MCSSIVVKPEWAVAGKQWGGGGGATSANAMSYHGGGVSRLTAEPSLLLFFTISAHLSGVCQLTY